MGREMARGFSVDWLTDFAFNSPGSFDHYATVIISLGIVSLVAELDPGRRSADTLQGAGAKVLVGGLPSPYRPLCLAFAALADHWPHLLLDRLQAAESEAGPVGGSLDEQWADDRAVFCARLAVSLLVILGLGFVNLVMDYARVRLVLEEGTGAIQAFLASLGFSLARLRKAIGVYVVPSLCGLALLGIYRLVVPWEFVNAAVGGPSHTRQISALAALFVVQQLVMFGRYWFRVATWASEWSLYAGTKHPPRPQRRFEG